MRVSVKGKVRKPPKYKNTAETFEFKAAVLTYYDTHTMAAAIGVFWSAIALRGKAYATKKRVVLRWKQHRSRIDSLAANTTTAKLKRYRAAGSAKTLSDDAELDLFEWLVAVRRNKIPVSATMLQQETLEIAKISVPFSLLPFAQGKNPTGSIAPADSDEVAQTLQVRYAAVL
ncbi:hypothetical protein PC113_g3593 [Phytophthora cactorum]|uniref:HTH CENPB-type domain-containing protein n=1 Tax=Phytophthora cactorum TaxID=29920 RepID=A0A8T0ZSV3_9STRA|nr:hypothetical protein PC113_g3593 [Phytophthora cactorum]